MHEKKRLKCRCVWERAKVHGGSAGFTLVELVVTLALLALLLGMSVFGLLAWQDHMRFDQENEYAAALYIAAQGQLSEYSRSGGLLELQEQLKYGDGYVRTISVESLTDSLGYTCESSSVWQQGAGTLCYAVCSKGDYEDYLAGNLSDEARARGADIVFMLLGGSIYDAGILNENISIEFTPEAGQVFSVCYSDQAEKFVYTDAGAGQVDIRSREESYRKTHMIGYYGGGTLAGHIGTSEEERHVKTPEAA